MSSTYLELTNRVLRRLNEVELDASTFASALGIHAATKDAVLDTVRKMNAQKFEWPFNAAAGSQVLTIGEEVYTWPADLRIPDWESFYIEKDDSLAVNTHPLMQISKEEWYKQLRGRDFDADNDGRSIPDFVFETDSGGFGVTPSPLQAYTVKYQYFIKTITLSADSDVCTIPSEYDYVIVDGALAYMYTFLDNDERAALKEKDFRDGLNYMAYILIPKSPRVRGTEVNFGGGSRFSRLSSLGYISN